MATSRLSLYNGALLLLGERKLSSLTEDQASRRALDSAWDAGAVDFILEQGMWNFAIRTQEIDAEPAIDPDFGYRYAFAKPSDWRRTAGLSADDHFSDPLLDYIDEAGYWWADLSPIYVRFVSNDASYGGDLSRWPQTVAKYAEAWLASEVAMPLTQSATKVEMVEAKLKARLKAALSNDAMNEPTRFPPAGSWSRARAGRSGRLDRGSRSSLIG